MPHDWGPVFNFADNSLKNMVDFYSISRELEVITGDVDRRY
jgi:hypothetical protein